MPEAALPMPTQGPLSPDGYARILVEVHRNRLSGLLLLKGPAETAKKVYFGDGFIVYATSNRPDDRLGNVLLQRGIISQEQFDLSSRLIKETGKKQGTLLVQMGAVDPKGLFQGLILQVTQIAESPFTWAEGGYQYQSTFAREEEMIILKIHPAAVTHEGLWKSAPPGGFPTLAGLGFKANPAPVYEGGQACLSPLEERILGLLPQAKTPADVAADIGNPLRMVTTCFSVLLRLGFILQAAEGGREKAAPATPASSPAADSGYRDEVIALSQKLPEMSHYEVLGIAADVNPQEVKAAYIKKAQEFHPERFTRKALRDLSPLAQAILRRVREAHEVLSDPVLRTEYDASLQGKQPAAPPGAAAGDKTLAAEQFLQGVRLLKCGETQDSIEAFRWATRLDPEKAEHHAGLAGSLLATGQRLKEAESSVRQAIYLDGANPAYWVILGRVYRKGKMKDKATGAFRWALELDPGCEEAIRELSTPADDPGASTDASILDKLLGS